MVGGKLKCTRAQVEGQDTDEGRCIVSSGFMRYVSGAPRVGCRVIDRSLQMHRARLDHDAKAYVHVCRGSRGRRGLPLKLDCTRQPTSGGRSGPDRSGPAPTRPTRKLRTD